MSCIIRINRVVVLIFSIYIFCYFSVVNSDFSLSNGCSYFGECSQICNNSECFCIKGFRLDGDGKSCNLLQSDWKLYFGGFGWFGYFQRFSNGSEKTEMLYSQQDGISYDEYMMIKGVTYDAISHRVFWSDQHLPGIYSRLENSTGEPEVVVKITERDSYHYGYAAGLAFDWVTGNLYYVKSVLREIVACRPDINSFCAVVVKDGHGRPQSLALHPNLGIMFWTDSSDHSPAIMRAGMDGTFVTRIATSNLKRPQGIAVDQGNARIYWTDPGRSVIESAKFDGSDRIVVLQSTTGTTPFSIDLLGDMVAWSFEEIDAINIVQHRFKDGNNRTIRYMKDDFNANYALTFFHPAQQPNSRLNTCSGESHCAHMCVLTPLSNPKDRRCLCPKGMHTHPTIEGACVGQLLCTSTKCIPAPISTDRKVFKDKLVIAFRNIVAVTISELGGKNTFYERIHFPEMNEIEAIAYNQVNDTIIIANKTKILEYHFESGNLTVLVEDGLESVSGMDIDSTTGILYWCDNSKGTVEAMSLATKRRDILMTDVENVTDILVAPGRGSFFLTEGSGKHRYTLGGSRLQFMNPSTNVPTSMVYDDFGSGYILWSGNHGNSIEAISLSSEMTMASSQVITATANPTVATNVSTIAAGSMAKYDDTIFWVDFHSLELKHVMVALVSHNSSSLTASKFLREDEQHQFAASGYQHFRTVIVTSRLPEDSQSANVATSSCFVEGCSHGCLSSGGCGCPQGFTLKEDGKTCKDTVSNSVMKDGVSSFSLDTYFWWFVCLSILFIVLLVTTGYTFIKLKPTPFKNLRPIVIQSNYEYGDN